MNTRRLLKLAKFLDNLPKKKFDFGIVVEKRPRCGTVACAMGWTPKLFPNLVEWGRSASGNPYYIESKNNQSCDIFEVAVNLFDIERIEACYLFNPGLREFDIAPWNKKVLYDDATPKQVAESIRRFIAYKKKL